MYVIIVKTEANGDVYTEVVARAFSKLETAIREAECRARLAASSECDKHHLSLDEVFEFERGDCWAQALMTNRMFVCTAEVERVEEPKSEKRYVWYEYDDRNCGEPCRSAESFVGQGECFQDMMEHAMDAVKRLCTFGEIGESGEALAAHDEYDGVDTSTKKVSIDIKADCVSLAIGMCVFNWEIRYEDVEV